jgi:hypothetical protein
MNIARSAAATFVAATLVLVLSIGLAQQDQPAETPAVPETEPQESLRTASYPLYPVEGVDVTGQLQIVEDATGGVQLVLTMVGIQEGRSYPAAIYVGSCGPDRPVYLELEPVGFANDPFVSITESEFTFEDVTQGEYFVYVFDGDTIDHPEAEGLDVPALACGEVGLGAVEGQP